MNEEKEKWIEDVFQSMKGSQRAKPRPELFSKIEILVGGLETKIVPIRQIRFAVAAAIIILVLNVFLLRQFIQNDEQQGDEMVVSIENYNQHIISNYKIYE